MGARLRRLAGRALALALAVGALGCLLPALAAAQWENRIGICLDPDRFDDRLYIGYGIFSAYFVLMSPRDADGAAIAACSGFELRAQIWGDPGVLFRLAEELPAGWTNALDSSDPWDASYRAGGAEPLPVSGDHVLLMTWTMLPVGGMHELWLLPLDTPTLAGSLAYWAPAPGGDVVVGARASGDYFPSPEVFLNPIFDRVENQSFGHVKALYR